MSWIDQQGQGPQRLSLSSVSCHPPKWMNVSHAGAYVLATLQWMVFSTQMLNLPTSQMIWPQKNMSGIRLQDFSTKMGKQIFNCLKFVFKFNFKMIIKIKEKCFAVISLGILSGILTYIPEACLYTSAFHWPYSGQSIKSSTKNSQCLAAPNPYVFDICFL